MPTPKVSKEALAARAKVINECLAEGFQPPNFPKNSGRGSVILEAARRLNIAHGTLGEQVKDGKIVPDWSKFNPPPVVQRLGSIKPPPPTSEERIEIRGLKDRIRTLETSLKEADREHLTEAAVRQEILGLSAHTAAPPEWLTTPPKQKSGIAGVPLTDWSDWHCGENVSLSETNGANQFNFEIAEKRIRTLAEHVIDLSFNHMTGANYPGIVVSLGGDMISGALHPELEETDEDDIFPTILWTFDRIVGATDLLLTRFPRIFFPCVPGNHGRVLDKKPHNKRYVYRNADWLLYSLLERHYKADKRVQFMIQDSGEALFRVYNHRYMSVHGDDLGVRGGDGIIGAIGPIMRGEIKMRTSSAQIGRDYDTLIVHHWHQKLWLPRAMVNNALKGYDEYARRTLRAVPTPASQNLWFTHPKWGITACWEVRLQETTAGATADWVSWDAGHSA